MVDSGGRSQLRCALRMVSQINSNYLEASYDMYLSTSLDMKNPVDAKRTDNEVRAQLAQLTSAVQSSAAEF